MATPPTQSVFDALAAGSSSKGSWADRIKSVDKSPVPLPAVTPVPTPTSAKAIKSTFKTNIEPQNQNQAQAEDGAWQQVTGKPAARKPQGPNSAGQQGQSQGSASRDWRDRTTDDADKQVKGVKRTSKKAGDAEKVEGVEAAVPTSTAALAEASGTPGSSDTPVAASVAPPVKTAAPAVNPWAVRREKMQTTPAPSATSASSENKSNGVTKKSATKVNGTPAETANKLMSSAKKVGKGQAPPPVTDDGSWPDVAKAVGALRATEKEKEKKMKADEASAAEAASTQAGKKQKWMAIPALELQAAADKAAENARRQAKAEQPRKKTSRNDGEESSPSRPPTRPTSRKPSISSPTKGKGIRLPGQKKSKDGVKPVFGTVSPTFTSDMSEAEVAGRQSTKGSATGSVLGLDTAGAGTKGDAGGSTLSRQVSRHSQPSSPHVEQGVENQDESRNRNFSASNRGRGRHDGGRGYGGRGRGGYRNGHMPSGPRSAYVSPNYANGHLPLADGAYGEYAYGYGYAPGYNYGGAYPLQIGGRAMPPPPMPVTQVPGLDFLRICLLGQVEYYFGMQNLAMDFFLRQQMDSEGWIDISMISSFNRVKSLTPDVKLVREMMLLSSILEVKDDCVRLSGGEAKRWVLPDAKQSTILSDPNERQIENGGEVVLGLPEDGAERWSTPNGGVESALLKSVPALASVPASSAVSVDDSDAVKEDTPATSMSGDHAEERKEMEMETIDAAVDALTAQQ